MAPTDDQTGRKCNYTNSDGTTRGKTVFSSRDRFAEQISAVKEEI